MAEDYTYTTVTDWRKRAHELARDVNELTRRAQELERENAELRARLDAVPVEAIELVHWGDSTSFGYVEACGMVGNWLVSVSELTPQAVQP